MSYFAHPTAVIDEGCEIGEGVKIWHFSHIMTGSKICDGCNIGQNVFIGFGVVLWKNVKVQNNVSLFEGVICEDDVFIGPSAVFTNVIKSTECCREKKRGPQNFFAQGCDSGCKCNHCVRKRNW